MFANRTDLEQWISKGRKTYGEIAVEKAIEILKTHRSEPLPEEVRQAIDAIQKRAETALAGKHFEA